MHDLTPIWRDLLAAVQDIGPRPATLEQYLVNGCMLVTWKQYAELRRTADNFEMQYMLSGYSVDIDRMWQDAYDEYYGTGGAEPPKPPTYPSIQVVAVGPTPVDVGADKIAFTVGDTIYVADKSVLDPPMPVVPAGGLRITENQ